MDEHRALVANYIYIRKKTTEDKLNSTVFGKHAKISLPLSIVPPGRGEGRLENSRRISSVRQTVSRSLNRIEEHLLTLVMALGFLPNRAELGTAYGGKASWVDSKRLSPKDALLHIWVGVNNQTIEPKTGWMATGLLARDVAITEGG